MAYIFSDVTKKEVGDGPCINGLRQMKAFFQSKGPDRFPAMSNLLENGYTKLLPQIKIEARILAKQAEDKDIKSTILSIGKAASKAKEILIMAEG